MKGSIIRVDSPTQTHRSSADARQLSHSPVTITRAPLQDMPTGVAMNGVSPGTATLTINDPRRMTVSSLGSLRKVSAERLDSPSRFTSDTITQTLSLGNENDSPSWSSGVGPATANGKSGRVIERLMAENDRLKRDLELQLLRSQELERSLQTLRPQLEALRAENSTLTHLKSVDGGLLARRDRKIESLKEDLVGERTRREVSEALVRSTLNDTEDALERAKRNIQQAQEEAKHATVHAGILEQSHRQLATDYRTRTQTWRKDLDEIDAERRADKTKLARLEVVADHMRRELERSRKTQAEYATKYGEYKQASDRWKQELEEAVVAESKRSKDLSDEMETVVNKMKWVMSNHSLQEERKGGATGTALKSYNVTAVNAISQDFWKAVEHLDAPTTATQLFYDYTLGIFHLECSSELGQLLHETFEIAIAAYHQRTAADENKDLQRFEWSTLPSRDREPDSYHDDDTEVVTGGTASAQTELLVLAGKLDTRTKAMALPLLDFNTDTKRHYKAVLRRLQTQLPAARVRLVKAVILDDFEDWVPAPLSINTAPDPADNTVIAALATPVAWHQLKASDLRYQEEQDTAEPSQAWRFIGKKPTVEQWLAGMGDDELIHPDSAADMPQREPDQSIINTTKKLTLGRARVPALPANTLAFEEQSGTKFTDTETSSDDDSVDLQAVLAGVNGNQSQTQHALNRSSLENAGSKSQQALPDTSSVTTSNPPAWTATPAAQSSRRSYARVDRHGLTGRPEAVVSWEKETGHTDYGSVVASNRSSCSASATTQQTNQLGATSIGRHIATQRGTPIWANKVVPSARSYQGALIEVEPMSSQDHSQIQNFKPTSNLPVSRSDKHTSDIENEPSIAATQTHAETVPNDLLEDLMTFSDSTEFHSVRSLSGGPDEAPCEHLALELEQPMHHVTMRQKARKNGKKQQQVEASSTSKTSLAVRPRKPLPTSGQQGKTTKQLSPQATHNTAVPDARQGSTNIWDVPAQNKTVSEPTMPLTGFATVLHRAISSSEMAIHVVQTSSGLCLFPDQDRHATATLIFQPLPLFEVEQALTGNRNNAQFAPLLLDAVECAATYSQVCNNLSQHGDNAFSTPSIKIRAELAMNKSSTTIEVEWSPGTGCAVSTLLLLEATKIVVCPRDLWDIKLSCFRHADPSTDKHIIAFVSSITLTPQGHERQSRPISWAAKIPIIDNAPAFDLKTLAISKSFIKRLTADLPIVRGNIQRPPPVAWSMTHLMHTTLSPLARDTGVITAVVASDKQAAVTDRCVWQTSLVTDITKVGVTKTTFDQFDFINQTFVGIMNKIYYGKHRPGDKESKSRDNIQW